MVILREVLNLGKKVYILIQTTRLDTLLLTNGSSGDMASSEAVSKAILGLCLHTELSKMNHFCVYTYMYFLLKQSNFLS